MTSRRLKILIVDDEPKIRELIGELISEAYLPIYAADAAEAVSVARKQSPSLILLDIIMPGVDGISACEQLRSNPITHHIPVLMLSAAGDLRNRVLAFNAGADDFISKPFDAEELLARIGAKVRRSNESVVRHARGLQCGNMTLDEKKRVAFVDETPIKLSALEFNLLHLFVVHNEHLVTRKDILKEVWGDSDVSDRLIDAHIVSLRKRIAGFLGNLKTVYGEGYILSKLESPGAAPTPVPKTVSFKS